MPRIVVRTSPGHTPRHASLPLRSDGLRIVAGDALMTRAYVLARDVYVTTVDRAAAVASMAAIAERADIVVPGQDNDFLQHGVNADSGREGADGQAC